MNDAMQALSTEQGPGFEQEPTYLTGFGNEHETEALPGALPAGRFSPQRPPYGLYAEKLSSTAFTAPRASNRRTWLYRIRPSVQVGPTARRPSGRIACAPGADPPPTPAPLRWDPFPLPDVPCDFVDGLTTLATGGALALQAGVAVHVYLANRSMGNRFFYDADGELLLVPQQGRLRIDTECGRLSVAPGEIAVVPRGLKFRVELPDGPSRGYVAENYGSPLRLPERGPVGSDGFANGRDFQAPTAAFEDLTGDHELVTKFCGLLYTAVLDHSPLDVVAWVGNSYPYKYDLARFNTMGTVSYDHPDPSIYTVLTAPSDTPGVANLDYVIFSERWVVAEDTFRPPWYHRNVMSEFMGLVHGVYDGKAAGFQPGGASLHNCMTAHGPDTTVFEQASEATLAPSRIASTLAFMFETRYPLAPTRYALEEAPLQADYLEVWRDLPRRYDGRR